METSPSPSPRTPNACHPHSPSRPDSDSDSDADAEEAIRFKSKSDLAPLAPAPAKPVPFQNVTITSAFWASRIRVVQRGALPAMQTQMKDTGRWDCLKLQWKPGDPNKPYVRVSRRFLGTHPSIHLLHMLQCVDVTIYTHTYIHTYIIS